MRVAGAVHKCLRTELRKVMCRRAVPRFTIQLMAESTITTILESAQAHARRTDGLIVNFEESAAPDLVALILAFVRRFEKNDDVLARNVLSVVVTDDGERIPVYDVPEEPGAILENLAKDIAASAVATAQQAARRELLRSQQWPRPGVPHPSVARSTWSNCSTPQGALPCLSRGRGSNGLDAGFEVGSAAWAKRQRSDYAKVQLPERARSFSQC